MQSSPEQPTSDNPAPDSPNEAIATNTDSTGTGQLPEAEAEAGPGFRTDDTSPSGMRGSRYLPGMQWAAHEAIANHGALQSPGELTALLSLLEGMGPKVILEIGTFNAGSAWALARVPSVRHIVTVDEAPRPEAAEVLAGLPCRATQVLGNTRLPQTTRAVAAALEGYRPNVVFIDGGHLYATARHDWDCYASMVTPGGLAVLHDTQGYPGNPTVQVPDLWAELREHYRTTEFVDTPGGPAGTGIVWL